jgi:hypothetical protein
VRAECLADVLAEEAEAVHHRHAVYDRGVRGGTTPNDRWHARCAEQAARA